MSLSLQQKNDFHFISDIIAQLNVFFGKCVSFWHRIATILETLKKKKEKKNTFSYYFV